MTSVNQREIKNSQVMGLNLIKIFAFTLLVLATLIGCSFTQTSTIPKEWHANLTLRFNTSHAMSGDMSDYYFTADSVFVHSRGWANNRTVEERYSKQITKAELNKLLEVLRQNRVDRLKIKKTQTTMYDGAAFSFHLIDNSNFIVMLSNGANYQLNDKDEAALFKVLIYIKSITQKN